MARPSGFPWRRRQRAERLLDVTAVRVEPEIVDFTLSTADAAARGEPAAGRAPCVSVCACADRAALWCEPPPEESGREGAWRWRWRWRWARSQAPAASGLARDRRALVAHTMNQFTHGARNDLSALRNLADLTLDGALTDTQAAREAIDDTFAQGRDTLRLVGLQARAAVPEGGRTRKLRQALRQQPRRRLSSSPRRPARSPSRSRTRC